MTIDLRHGDCRTLLREMPDKSVHCVVTSPPYFGLRDYGVDGQIGLEQTPDEYVAEMVGVFREVHRVLRDDGTLWLNLGDSYTGSGKGGNPCNSHHVKQKSNAGSLSVRNVRREGVGLKHKDLIGIPWRVAFALQADGWYLRQDIVWHKPNPMPESVKDRCTKAHEYIFMLSKSARYYFDAEAVKEPLAESSIPRLKQNVEAQTGTTRAYGKKNGNFKAQGNLETGLRNRRSVWTVTTKPFKGAHFATFPPDLIEPCILAGCPRDGTVLDPFGGAGTSGLVAKQHKRNAILIELNSDYVDLARRRIGTAVDPLNNLNILHWLAAA